MALGLGCLREQVRVAMAHAHDAENAARIRAQVRRSLAHGAEGMVRGADNLDRGAGKVGEAVARLRKPAYREQIIARQRAEGRVVTHQDLIEAAEGMEAGAEGLREGAVRMRECAVRMREGRQ